MPSTSCLKCGALSKGSYCAAHQPSYRHPGRGSSSQATAFRAAVLTRAGGRCELCHSTDRVQAHHVIGLAEGGTNDPTSNGQALCHTHHVAIERRRVFLKPPDSTAPPGAAQKPDCLWDRTPGVRQR